MSSTQGTFILTGAFGGIGFAISREYIQAAYPYTGIFAVRDLNSLSAQPLQRLLSQSDEEHTVESLDLSRLSSVRAFATSLVDRINENKLPPIRALLLNAGMQETKCMTFTPDGYETTFAVNYLANFLLVQLLLPVMDKTNGRIVIVSSSAHDPTHWLNQSFKPENISWREPEELARRPVTDEPGDETNGGLRRYGASKLWTVMFMYELQRQLDANPSNSNISITSVNPGAVAGTGLTRSHGWFITVFAAAIMQAGAFVMGFFMTNPPFRTAQWSAKDLLGACFQDDGPPFGELEERKAAYFDGKVKVNSSEESRDEDKQRKLWERSLGLVGLVSLTAEEPPA